MATTLESNNTYTDDAFKYKLWNSLNDRNQVFGYDKVVQHPVQVNLQNNHFMQGNPGTSGDIRTAPKDYYFDLRVDPKTRANIGPLGARPNIYNDLQYPWTNNLNKPNLYKNWQPLTTSNTDGLVGQPVRYVAHNPVELAPNYDPKYKTADLNALIYERKIRLEAQEQPYANFNRRAAQISLMSQNVKFRSDGYMKLITRPEDAFANRDPKLEPPAVTGFP